MRFVKKGWLPLIKKKGCLKKVNKCLPNKKKNGKDPFQLRNTNL